MREYEVRHRIDGLEKQFIDPIDHGLVRHRIDGLETVESA